MAVTVWLAPSWLSTVTVAPAGTVNDSGTRTKSLITTAVAGAVAGLADVAAGADAPQPAAIPARSRDTITDTRGRTGAGQLSAGVTSSASR